MEKEILEIMEIICIENLVDNFDKIIYKICKNKFLKIYVYTKYKPNIDWYGRIKR